MKLHFLLGLSALLLLSWFNGQVDAGNQHGADIEDNEFAEFEEFDDEDGAPAEPAAQENKQNQEAPPKKVVMAPEAAEAEAENTDEEDATVEDDEDEYDHFQDDEEFEGFDPDSKAKGKGQEKPLEITKVPLLRTNWDSFYLEMLMLAGLGVYCLNFLAGKSKNSKLATAWFNAHKELLETNFSIVGDDGTAAEPQNGMLMKESENVYSLWCSGRMCCEGMLVTIKLLKRQDLVSTISRMLKPASDQIIVKVEVDEADMDTFVLCLANKKVCGKMQKDMADLSSFCPEKKSVDKFGLPPSFQLLSEIPEATAQVLDSRVVAALNKYENMVEFMHISDMFTGPRQQDEQPTKMPETKKVMIFGFNVPTLGRSNPTDMENMKPLMQMVFHILDKIKRIRLSRESKGKAEKNRQKMQEQYLKAAHAQRSEAAQNRREEKRRAEKERMMNEDDPDKQRKLEERNLKRDNKKKQAKSRMMKVKAM